MISGKKIEWKRILSWAVLICLFVFAVILSMLSYVATAENGGTYSTLKKIVYGIVLFAIAVSMVYLYGKKQQDRIKPEVLYLMVGIAFSIIYLLIIPIGATPDERRHMYTAYDLSNSIMGIDKGDATNVLARQDDVSFEFKSKGITKKYYQSYYSSFFNKLNDDTLVESEVTPLDAPKFLYFFSSLGITLGRLLGCGTIITFFMGQVFNSIVFICAMYYSIKKIPFGKCVLFVWALLPMVLQQTNSYSYDSFIFALCAVITALTLKFLYGDQKIKKSEIIIYALAIILLIPCKGHALFPIAAFSLLLIVKLVKGYKKEIADFIEGHKKIIKRIAIVCGILLLVAVVFSLIRFVKWMAIPEVVGIRYRPKYFLQHPDELVAILYQTFADYGEMYLREMIGDPLGYIYIRVSLFPILVYILLLIAASIRRENEPIYIGYGTRIYMWLIFIAVCALAVAGMLFYWTYGGAYKIDGVQGRYFLPAFPIALIACRSSRMSIKPDADRTIMLAAVYIQVFVIVCFFRNFG